MVSCCLLFAIPHSVASCCCLEISQGSCIPCKLAYATLPEFFLQVTGCQRRTRIFSGWNSNILLQAQLRPSCDTGQFLELFKLHYSHQNGVWKTLVFVKTSIWKSNPTCCLTSIYHSNQHTDLIYFKMS